MIEKHDLMVSSMQHLHKSVASSNAADGIPSVIFNSSPDDGDVIYSAGKPEAIYSKLNEYYDSIPIVDNEQQV